MEIEVSGASKPVFEAYVRTDGLSQEMQKAVLDCLVSLHNVSDWSKELYIQG